MRNEGIRHWAENQLSCCIFFFLILQNIVFFLSWTVLRALALTKKNSSNKRKHVELLREKKSTASLSPVSLSILWYHFHAINRNFCVIAMVFREVLMKDSNSSQIMLKIDEQKMWWKYFALTWRHFFLVRHLH